MQAILRELPLSEGRISVNGVVSYASQEPWLFVGSVKKNILFGSSMDENRYKQVNVWKLLTHLLLSRYLNLYFLERLYIR